MRRVSILLRMLASPRHQRYPEVACWQLCFNPTQDACFPTTMTNPYVYGMLAMFQSYSGCLLPHDVQIGLFEVSRFVVSILLRMLASPRRGELRPPAGRRSFQSYSGCLLPHDNWSSMPISTQSSFNPTQDACFPTTWIDRNNQE